MKCDELKPIELECNMGKDINGVDHREPWKAYDIDEVDEAIAELKDETRKLKRALWLARARGAHNAAMMWEILSDDYLIGAQFTIDFRCIGDPDVTEFQMFRNCMDWMKIYENVERKCREKAEEYK